MRKIALEEHFLSPGFEDYWLPTMGGVDQKAVSGLFARLQDFGDTRLKAMDSGGIARAVLSISGPGVQVERDAATARRRATEANDFWPAKSSSGPTAIPALGTCPCKMRAPPPTNWNAAFAT
jgi:2,3-dihydroxybenzoate decarboxylase